MSLTTDQQHPNLDQPKDNGQNQVYLVLSEEERSRGFVRPVRTSYRHVGVKGPTYQLRNLTEQEQQRYDGCGYIKFEQYPESDSPITGRFWTQEQLDSVNNGCGVVTTMNQTIAETYARDPNFYGATFCVGCKQHFPVDQFVWDQDGSRVGS